MTTTDEFEAPASAVGIKWDDYNGDLLLVAVKQVESGIKTSFGEKDAVRADVTILDGTAAGEEFLDTLIFPSVLISQTRSAVGKKVLGRLGQGQAKPGQKPPWRLIEATDEDAAVARAHLAKIVSPGKAPF